MAKATNNWFRHSVNAHLNQKLYSIIVNEGLKYYGAYWVIIEMCATVALDKDDGVDHFEFHKSRFLPNVVKRSSHLNKLLGVLCKNGVINYTIDGSNVILTGTQVYEYIGFYSPKEKKEKKEIKRKEKNESSSLKKQGEKDSTTVPETPQEVTTSNPEPEDNYQHSIKSNGQIIHMGSYLGESKPPPQRSSKKTSREDYDTFIKTFFGLKQLGDCKSYYGKIDDFLNSTGRNIADLQQAALNIEFMKNNTNKFGYFTKNLDTLLDPTKDFDKYLDSSLCGFFIDKSAPRDTIYINLSEEEGKKALDELRRKGVLK